MNQLLRFIKILFLIALFLAFKIINSFADSNNPCVPSIKLKEPEYGYGVPFIEELNLSKKEYEGQIQKYALFQNNYNKLLELGYAALNYHDYQNADKMFNLAANIKNITLEPELRKEFYYLGIISEKHCDFVNALKYYMKYGDPYFIHEINAKINENQGDLKSAEKEYLLMQSVQLYEMLNYEPYYYLAEMFYKHNVYDKAKNYIIKYIECVKYELEDGGEGYTPEGENNITKAKVLLKKIEEKLK